jgi:hypothetical protein
MPDVIKCPEEALPPDPDAFLALVDRADKGDEAALPELRKWMRNPNLVDILGGDLARHAEQLIINAAAGKRLGFREAVLGKMELMRQELAGPNPSPLERLLVERVVACWLQLQNADILLAQGEARLSISQAEYHQRRCDRAHKRYLGAIRTLATVRKLALPVLQVNIARKQVNVAGPCLPADDTREAV